MVSDAVGKPAANVEIFGWFIDGIKESVVATTDERGTRLPGKPLTDVIYPAPCCPLKTPPTL